MPRRKHSPSSDVKDEDGETEEVTKKIKIKDAETSVVLDETEVFQPVLDANESTNVEPETPSADVVMKNDVALVIEDADGYARQEFRVITVPPGTTAQSGGAGPTTVTYVTSDGSPVMSTNVVGGASGQSSEEKRNLSLEALFQAAHSELENISKVTVPGQLGSHGDGAVARPDPAGQDSQAASAQEMKPVIDVLVTGDDGVTYELKTDASGKHHLVVTTANPAAMFGQPLTSGEVVPAKPSPPISSLPTTLLVAQSVPRPEQTHVAASVAPVVTQVLPGNSHNMAAMQGHSQGGRRRKHPQKPGKYICGYCGRGCAKPSVLQKHVRAHTGERPYPCLPCGFAFKTKSNLYKHCKSRWHSVRVDLGAKGSNGDQGGEDMGKYLNQDDPDGMEEITDEEEEEEDLGDGTEATLDQLQRQAGGLEKGKKLLKAASADSFTMTTSSSSLLAMGGGPKASVLAFTTGTTATGGKRALSVDTSAGQRIEVQSAGLQTGGNVFASASQITPGVKPATTGVHMTVKRYFEAAKLSRTASDGGRIAVPVSSAIQPATPIGDFGVATPKSQENRPRIVWTIDKRSGIASADLVEPPLRTIIPAASSPLDNKSGLAGTPIVVKQVPIPSVVTQASSMMSLKGMGLPAPTASSFSAVPLSLATVSMPAVPIMVSPTIQHPPRGPHQLIVSQPSSASSLSLTYAGIVLPPADAPIGDGGLRTLAPAGAKPYRPRQQAPTDIKLNIPPKFSLGPIPAKMSPVNPKNLTPEMLQERISKLISDNAAIVSTPMADAPRPKRVTRQISEPQFAMSTHPRLPMRASSLIAIGNDMGQPAMPFDTVSAPLLRQASESQYAMPVNPRLPMRASSLVAINNDMNQPVTLYDSNLPLLAPSPNTMNSSTSSHVVTFGGLKSDRRPTSETRKETLQGGVAPVPLTIQKVSMAEDTPCSLVAIGSASPQPVTLYESTIPMLAPNNMTSSIQLKAEPEFRKESQKTCLKSSIADEKPARQLKPANLPVPYATAVVSGSHPMRGLRSDGGGNVLQRQEAVVGPDPGVPQTVINLPAEILQENALPQEFKIEFHLPQPTAKGQTSSENALNFHTERIQKTEMTGDVDLSAPESASENNSVIKELLMKDTILGQARRAGESLELRDQAATSGGRMSTETSIYPKVTDEGIPGGKLGSVDIMSPLPGEAQRVLLIQGNGTPQGMATWYRINTGQGPLTVIQKDQTSGTPASESKGSPAEGASSRGRGRPKGSKNLVRRNSGDKKPMLPGSLSLDLPATGKDVARLCVPQSTGGGGNNAGLRRSLSTNDSLKKSDQGLASPGPETLTTQSLWKLRLKGKLLMKRSMSVERVLSQQQLEGGSATPESPVTTPVTISSSQGLLGPTQPVLGSHKHLSLQRSKSYDESTRSTSDNTTRRTGTLLSAIRAQSLMGEGGSAVETTNASNASLAGKHIWTVLKDGTVVEVCKEGQSAPRVPTNCSPAIVRCSPHVLAPRSFRPQLTALKPFYDELPRVLNIPANLAYKVPGLLQQTKVPTTTTTTMTTGKCDVTSSLAASGVVVTSVMTSPRVTLGHSPSADNEVSMDTDVNEGDEAESTGADVTMGAVVVATDGDIQVVTATAEDTSTAASPESGPTSPGMQVVVANLSKPRKDKVKVALMLLGHSYPVLQSNTLSTFCSLQKPQPMYVQQGSSKKISMYSTWRAAAFNPNPMGLTTKTMLRLYQTQRFDVNPKFAVSPLEKQPSETLTHSSYWDSKQRDGDDDAAADTAAVDFGQLDFLSPAVRKPVNIITFPDMLSAASSPLLESTTIAKEATAGKDPSAAVMATTLSSESLLDGSPAQGAKPRVVKIFEGGFKSTEEYVYIRGRGYGKYICERCGIRCKKPSMLKKHIRTHTDIRPYNCRFCKFSFKTKGNLTKHMKSKAHHKVCTDMGIRPVPTTVDDNCIQGEVLAQQSAVFYDNEPPAVGHTEEVAMDQTFDDDDDDDEDDDDDDEDEDAEVSLVEASVDQQGVQFEVEVETAPAAKAKGSPKAPTFAALRAAVEGQPTLVRIGEGGEPIVEQEGDQGMIFSIAVDEEKLGTPRASIDKEIAAASLLDLSKGPEVDSDGQVNTSGSRSESESKVTDEELAEEKAGSASDATKGKEQDNRLDHLIGALISRTMTAGEKEGQRLRDESPEEDRSSPRKPAGSVTGLDGESPLEGAAATDHGGFFPPYLKTSDTYAQKIAALQMANDKDLRSGLGRQFSISGAAGFIPPAFVTSGSGLVQLASPTGPRVLAFRTKVARGAPGGGAKVKAGDMGPIVGQLLVRDVEGMGMGMGMGEGDLLLATVAAVSSNSSAPSAAEGGAGGATVATSGYPLQQLQQQQQQQPQQLQQPSGVSAAEEQLLLVPGSVVSLVDSNSNLTLEEQLQEQIKTFVKVTVASAAESRLERMKIPTKVANIQGPPLEIMPIPVGEGGGEAALAGDAAGGDAKFTCDVCQATFRQKQQLTLHLNIHYLEKPYRCEDCSLAFASRMLLDKHQSSERHQAVVTLMQQMGSPTSEDPRPYKCEECNIAFRIQGHLARHLRSKMHIGRLETLGKMPPGTYDLGEGASTSAQSSSMVLLIDDQSPSQDDGMEVGDTLGDDDVMGDDDVIGEDYALSKSKAESAASIRPKLTRKSAIDIASEDSSAEGAGVASRQPSMMYYTSESAGDVTGDVTGDDSRVEIITIPEVSSDVITSGAASIKIQISDAASGVATARALPVRDQFEYRQSQTGEYEKVDVASNENVTVEMKSEPIELGEILPKSAPRNVDEPDIEKHSGNFHAPHKCGLCGRTFKVIAALKRHLVTHAELRPYVCEYCDAGFTTAQSLKFHLRTHTQERPYVCRECGETFALSDAHKVHLRSHYTESGDDVETPFSRQGSPQKAVTSVSSAPTKPVVSVPLQQMGQVTQGQGSGGDVLVKSIGQHPFASGSSIISISPGGDGQRPPEGVVVGNPLPAASSPPSGKMSSRHALQTLGGMFGSRVEATGVPSSGVVVELGAGDCGLLPPLHQPLSAGEPDVQEIVIIQCEDSQDLERFHGMSRVQYQTGTALSQDTQQAVPGNDAHFRTDDVTEEAEHVTQQVTVGGEEMQVIYVNEDGLVDHAAGGGQSHDLAASSVIQMGSGNEAGGRVLRVLSDQHGNQYKILSVDTMETGQFQDRLAPPIESVAREPATVTHATEPDVMDESTVCADDNDVGLLQVSTKRQGQQGETGAPVSPATQRHSVAVGTPVKYDVVSSTTRLNKREREEQVDLENPPKKWRMVVTPDENIQLSPIFENEEVSTDLTGQEGTPSVPVMASLTRTEGEGDVQHHGNVHHHGDVTVTD